MMTTLLIISLGFIFGGILQYSNLNKFNTISGLAVRENYSVLKAIAIAVGIGMILINVEISLGLASFHVKPFILGGIVLGGLIFGIGMAILGYCPGTIAISAGQGSTDALFGIVGGLLGGLLYTLVLPYIAPILGPDFGKLSLNSLLGDGLLFYAVLLIVGGLFIYIAFVFQKIDKNKDKKWIVSGVLLAILSVVIFSNNVTGRPIGASTAFPYMGDSIACVTDGDYFTKITKSGNWEMLFLLGSFISGLVISLYKKQFKFKLIQENWIKYKGNSKLNRIIWSVLGGVILIFGARMAGGCTSGHIISGGMQFAISSLVFAIFTFVGLLITGQLFYLRKK